MRTILTRSKEQPVRLVLEVLKEQPVLLELVLVLLKE